MSKALKLRHAANNIIELQGQHGQWGNAAVVLEGKDRRNRARTLQLLDMFVASPAMKSALEQLADAIDDLGEDAEDFGEVEVSIDTLKAWRELINLALKGVGDVLPAVASGAAHPLPAGRGSVRAGAADVGGAK